MSDSMAMNRINPYTSTGTFGVSSNGGYKSLKPVIRVESEVNDDLMFPAGEMDKDYGVPRDHFNPLALDHAGNMYLGTGSVHPARTFIYPARKYEFDDGSTSYGRQVTIENIENYPTSLLYKDEEKGQLVLFFMVILFVVLLLLKPFKFR
jgi:hypothetical protein